MSVNAVISGRKSVRTFSPDPLSPDLARQVMDFAASVENPYGLPIEYRLLDAETEGLSCPVLVGARIFIGGKLALAPHAEEAFGFAFERVLLRACELGLGTVWIAGTMDRPAFERAMGLQSGEFMPAVSPLGVAAARRSVREGLMRKGIQADRRLDFGALFFDGAFGRPLSAEAAGRFADALESVRWAPSAVNKQPWRVVIRDGAAHFYEQKNMNRSDGAGWDVQKVDLGIALCHFAMALESRGVVPEFSLADPGIAMPEGASFIATYRLP